MVPRIPPPEILARMIPPELASRMQGPMGGPPPQMLAGMIPPELANRMPSPGGPGFFVRPPGPPWDPKMGPRKEAKKTR